MVYAYSPELIIKIIGENIPNEISLMIWEFTATKHPLPFLNELLSYITLKEYAHEKESTFKNFFNRVQCPINNKINWFNKKIIKLEAIQLIEHRNIMNNKSIDIQVIQERIKAQDEVKQAHTKLQSHIDHYFQTKRPFSCRGLNIQKDLLDETIHAFLMFKGFYLKTEEY